MLGATLVISLTRLVQGEELQLEIIPLQHRLVEEMLPVLRPLLAPGGTISGMNNQLIVRSTASNIAELKQVLQQTDHAVRRFKIYVRQTTAGRTESAGGGVYGGYDSERGANLAYRSYNTRGRNDTSNLHFVQAIEGQPAYITTGQSVPVQNRSIQFGANGLYLNQNTDYRDVDTGFDVVTRAVGNQVTLTVSPHQARLNTERSDVINSSTAQTTVSGQLGEWLDIAGANQDFADTDSGYSRSTQRRGAEVRNIQVLVEEIP